MPVSPGEPFGPFPADTARRLFYDGMSPQEAAAFSGRLQPESPQAVLEATRWTAELDVSGIKVPVLAVGAANDQLVPAASVKSMAGAIPGASYVHLPGAGHGVPVNPGWPSVMSMVTSWASLAARHGNPADAPLGRPGPPGEPDRDVDQKEPEGGR